MKKFSNKWINSWKLLEKAVVGFEVEFYSSHSFNKTVEKLNLFLDGIKVHGFRRYHAPMVPDEGNWKLEIDTSGGESMLELITGPLKYFEARHYLSKILNFVDQNGWTNRLCSIHLNLSFQEETGLDISKLDPLKFILEFNEQEVYDYFPNREHNLYARSILRILPNKNYHYAEDAYLNIRSSFNLPLTKYFGINFSHLQSGRLEYRYIGGTNYQRKLGEILELLDSFIITSHKSLENSLSEEDERKLQKIISINRDRWQSFSTMDEFMSYHPGIDLRVDLSNDVNFLRSYWERIKDPLFDFFYNVLSLEGQNILFNWDNDKQRLEIKNIEAKMAFACKNITFINCKLTEGEFENCDFVKGDITNSHLKLCEVYNTEVRDCRLLGVFVNNSSEIYDCYFLGGTLQGRMNGGIFRRGRIKQGAYIGPDTRVIDSQGQLAAYIKKTQSLKNNRQRGYE